MVKENCQKRKKSSLHLEHYAIIKKKQVDQYTSHVPWLSHSIHKFCTTHNKCMKKPWNEVIDTAQLYVSADAIKQRWQFLQCLSHRRVFDHPLPWVHCEGGLPPDTDTEETACSWWSSRSWLMHCMCERWLSFCHMNYTHPLPEAVHAVRHMWKR